MQCDTDQVAKAAEKTAKEQAKVTDRERKKAHAKQRRAVQKEDLSENKGVDKIINLTLAETLPIRYADTTRHSEWEQVISSLQNCKATEVVSAIRLFGP
jgi:hypothetical protein